MSEYLHNIAYFLLSCRPYAVSTPYSSLPDTPSSSLARCSFPVSSSQLSPSSGLAYMLKAVPTVLILEMSYAWANACLSLPIFRAINQRWARSRYWRLVPLLIKISTKHNWAASCAALRMMMLVLLQIICRRISSATAMSLVTATLSPTVRHSCHYMSR